MLKCIPLLTLLLCGCSAPKPKPTVVTNELLPPLPLVVPQKSAKPFIETPPHKWYLVFSNPSPFMVTWTIETRSDIGEPWLAYASSNHIGPGEVWTEIFPTQTQCFFRVGFK